MFLTPSGRFEVNTKVCLSFSAYHPELWQPAWGIRLILEALISFLPAPADGAIGALDYSKEERKRLAKASVNYCCPRCGNAAALLPKLGSTSGKSKATGKFADQVKNCINSNQPLKAQNRTEKQKRPTRPNPKMWMIRIRWIMQLMSHHPLQM